MSKQYWIGGFFIDLSRNQITQNQHTQTLAPKALAVLTYLAEHQGQVVSQDELLSAVWPNTIVSPNTLQRSIAQLRKALGDDGKGQIYIKTHAKQGYSLECDVHWDGHRQASPASPHPPTQAQIKVGINTQDRLKIFAVAGIAALALVLMITLQNRSNQTTTDFGFGTLRSLTATDDKEFDATYSPDGQYIVFHRYAGLQCNNRLWAKHIETQQEIPLTANWGAYGSHDFSPDGKQLVFFATESCLEPATQKDCYDLVTLDFQQALLSPQEPTELLRCKQSKAVKPMWLDDDNIAFLQNAYKRWKLINYNIHDDRSTELVSRQSGNLVDFTFSTQLGLMAVSVIDEHNQQHLELRHADGQLRSSHPVQRPADMAPFRIIRPSFDPKHERMIFSTGRQLFTLTYTGQVAKLNLPVAERMAQPVFHPEGNRLLMIKGPYDSDVVRLSLDALPASLTTPYPPTERTNLGEDFAQFQPNGSLIAFWSERSGEPQIWLSKGTSPQQLTDFPIDSFIQGFDWAADGQSLLVNANNQLFQVNLTGEQTALDLAHPVLQLYQWDSENNQALLSLRLNGVSELVAYDLLTNSHRVLTERNIQWAQMTADMQLIYKDALDQFWRPGPVEPQLIEALNGQGDRGQSFLVQDQTIYAINSRHQLWAYDLDTDRFSILGTVRQEVDYLTDITHDELLLTIQVAAKKEVVEWGPVISP